MTVLSPQLNTRVILKIAFCGLLFHFQPKTSKFQKINIFSVQNKVHAMLEKYIEILKHAVFISYSTVTIKQN